uniref:NFE2 like bZIP transcription factor 2 n=1 Tax=Leptobrachium leishanense TaxID=445787 RepID=A0A8C5WKL4_9ANUR
MERDWRHRFESRPEHLSSECPWARHLKDMDLIDILWKQDIDLGVGREVFDYQQRQKEYELEKQKKLEKERLEQLQKEQEKALYTHLQLDEETGEFIPIQQAPPAEITSDPQTLTRSLQTKDCLGSETALSSEDFLKLLTDAFPFVVENEEYQSSWLSDPALGGNQNFLYSGPNTETGGLQSTASNGDHDQEMDQAWEELLSITELKGLNHEMNNMVDLSMYQTPECPAVTDPADNYNFLNSMSAMEKPVGHTVSPFLDDLGGSFASSIPAVNTNTSFHVDSFCDNLLTLIDTKLTNVPLEDSSGQCLNEILPDTVDITDLSQCKAFNGSSTQEFNDSDSGISIHTSPCGTSPGQSLTSSVYDDGQYGYSDSEMDDTDSSPEAVQHDLPEKYKYTISEESFFSLSPFIPQEMVSFEMDELNSPASDLPASPGHATTPFTKDKSLSRLEARFTRDEQRAKALNIPFSVDTIVNLPVDDFNAMMSKHEFSEAQLALIRDIRRRGKNKVAAQNCRKRKMENIVELETDLDQLKNEKDKLLAEKGEFNTSLLQLKKQIGTLYMEVFSKLRDEDGKPYSSNEYSLQQTKDGNVFLVPKAKKLEIKKE